jgi:hypothetical protein
MASGMPAASRMCHSAIVSAGAPASLTAQRLTSLFITALALAIASTPLALLPVTTEL